MRSLDFRQLKVFPLKERASLTRAEEILVDPSQKPKPCSPHQAAAVERCAKAMIRAREKGAGTMLIYGAHLLRNGAARILDDLMKKGWLRHLATNGAGTIHDWEYAWFGASTESVEANVATGTFGAWEETARNIHLALMTGALEGLGYGRSLGKFITEDGALVPSLEELAGLIRGEPDHPLTAARADLLQTLKVQSWPSGRIEVRHPWKQASILASAHRHGVPLSVHPGIGYDIISNHPAFNGAAIGRAGGWDFALFGGSLEAMEGGVVLSIGSAIMGPQVFEKSLSCVNNLRYQKGLGPLTDLTIFVVDLQDGGNWDWTQGEPPKTNPAYYLRFCKSYSRMGGTMHYLQMDNLLFVHHLHQALGLV